jgi:bacterioferritin
MKIKLKEARPIKLTKASDLLIMKQSGAVGGESLVTPTRLRAWQNRERGDTMKAKEGVVNILNKILTADLTAINQYFVHAKMCENWGYDRLHHKVRERSIAEMKDADELIGHILYLDGVPNVQRMNTVQVGETVPEQLKLDLKAEQEMLALLNDGVVHCTKVTDFTTRHMLEDMAKDVDQHIDWIETQMETIKQVGLENYLAEQIKKDS